MKTTTKTTIGLSLAFFCIIIVGFTFVRSTERVAQNANWVRHTVEVRQQLERLSSVYMQAQNNVRGFHLTAQDHYLKLHQEATGEIPTILQKIGELVKDNPRQIHYLATVKDIISERVRRWGSTIEVRRKEGLNAIINVMVGQEGKITDFKLSEALDSMKREEELLFSDRQKEFQESAQFSTYVGYIGGTLALVLILLAIYIVHRDSRRRELAESELDRFFSLSLDLLCISGMDGYFKRLGPAFQDVLGFSLKELYSKPVVEFVHPDDREKTIKEIERQSQGHKVLAFENRFLCKDGSYKVLSWKSVPVDGLMYAVARDITTQRIYEEELIAARELAQQGTKAKSEFLANMSHEIRTPLNGIIGMTDLFTKTDMNAEQREQISVIRQSGMHLLKVINEVLDFSKIEAGRLQLEMLNFSLVQLFASQISLIGISAHEKSLKLHSMVDPKIPDLLRGDSGRIGQVILNLLGNAVKFTQHGTITLKANLESLEDQHCWIRFSVTDTGMGMSVDQMSRLFVPFSQADNSTSRKFGGTGLGLSICKRLVEMMGGVIGVESAINGGSTFWFKLKFDIPQLEAERAAAATAVNLPAFDPNQKQLKVLVAEDNFVNQLIIMKMLEKLGCITHVVANGEEAVRAFKEHEYDIVFMDYHMPLMDGSEATQHIRRLELNRGTRVPILAFTANVFPEDQAKCLEAGMDDFILKPVTISVLEKSLAKWRDAIRT